MMLSRVCISSFLIALTVAGCATKAPAPVAERTRPGSSAQSKPESPVPVPSTPVARPGYYIVKPGDTLIRIALDQGQNYRDIAAWSGLENANLIEVGQELRVRPPESAAVSRPVSSNGGEVRPAAAVVNSDGVRREPKGGKVAYSEQAWALAQKPEAPVVLAKIDAKPEVRPEAKPEVKAEPVKPEAKDDKKAEPAKPAGSDDKIDWAWPASGKIIAGFNETSSKGVDLSGKPGDPVLAAAGGRVVYAGTGLRGYGKLVIVKHDNSYLSAYAHNQSLLVKEGQAVSKGQKIAELGDTDSDRPKLHFEIRRQGKPVDPGKYLPPR
ncbi:LysM peptidoglycan-binding domain-containing protein [Zoogloea oleivorans]|uniref:LysM peptidoglycan-binding domain-containing protein n=3 Tax=Zoogloea oleivorans TaxID=1552750 RepID=A0A6C2D8W4_9RHOO|nr:peptidoglycan DD-metalloendopeptidase family protein [Zoogloea sp.]TYC62313.1 LysM peptidoglycan-binding domain-containing protein [Zoogloea oleivorans]